MSWCWICFLMPEPLNSFWKLSEIPMCLNETGEDSECHNFFLFLPGLASGKEGMIVVRWQWSLRNKMQHEFLQQAKSFYSSISSHVSSLALLWWLFAQLLLGQHSSPWPSKQTIGGGPWGALSDGGVRQEPPVCWVQGLSSAQQGPDKVDTWSLLTTWEINICQLRQTKEKII